MPQIKENNFQRCTPKQQNYIAILANDLGYNRAATLLVIKDIIHRTIAYLDEMSVIEGSKVIEEFMRRKTCE